MHDANPPKSEPMRDELDTLIQWSKNRTIVLVGNDLRHHFPVLAYGGIEIAVEELAVALHDHNVSFHVIAPTAETNTNILCDHYGFSILSTGSDIVKGISYCNRVKTIIRAMVTPPDILWMYGPCGIDRLDDLDIPVISTRSDSGSPQQVLTRENALIRFISTDQGDRWRAMHQGKLDDHSFDLYYGFSDNEFREPTTRGNKLIFMAGRLVRSKGIHWLCELARAFPGRLFVAYGNNKAPDSSCRGLRNVDFPGMLDRKDQESVLQEADGFIMTSQWEEAFGRTLVEAMSKGVPVIASCQGSLPEIVTNQGGICRDSVSALIRDLPEYLDTVNRTRIFQYAKHVFAAKNEVQGMLKASQILLDVTDPRERANTLRMHFPFATSPTWKQRCKSTTGVW